MSKRISRAAAIALAATAFGPAAAYAAPPQLLNKTITVSFSVSISGKGADGSMVTHPRQTTRQIYVSTQGRVFVKGVRSAGKRSDVKERGPEGGGALRFAGNRLVGVLKFISGASQLSISFDPSYQSCTAQIIMGAESGKPIVWKGLNGVTYTATSKPSVSTPSCSIQQGNAFAS